MNSVPEPTGPSPAPNSLERIGNAERERTVQRLQKALGEGRLEIGEFDERMAATYAARTAGQLAPLTADLPADEPRRPATSLAPEAPPSGRPAKNSQAWLAWAWRAWAVAVSINLVVWLAVTLSTGDAPHFWPMWVAGPWGAVLLVNTVFARLGQRTG